jgi:threonine dehydratase
MMVMLGAVEEARRNIAPVALRTPLVRCPADTRPEVWLKLENLQPIGSFKIRGAANVTARTPHERLARGTKSAGPQVTLQAAVLSPTEAIVCATLSNGA